MEIEKVGDIDIIKAEEYFIDPDYHMDELSYFAPCIHEDYNSYIPPVCYSIGRSAYVDFKANRYVNLTRRQYSPEYCSFGTDFTLDVEVDLLPTIISNTCENAHKIAYELYSRSTAYGNYNIPNLEDINIPRVTEKGGNPLLMESVNIVKPSTGLQRFGLNVTHIELQPQAQLPKGLATGNCGVIGELWGRVDVDAITAGDFKFAGRLYLSPEPDERAQGIFTGYVDVDIPVLLDIKENVYDDVKQTCGEFLIETTKSILRARLTVKVNTFILDGEPATFTAYLFNNGNLTTKQFHGDYVPPKDGLVNDKAYFFEQIDETDFILMYRSAIMMSGDDNQPYYTLFALEYFRDNSLLDRTILASHKYSSQDGLYTSDISPYDNLESIKTFYDLILNMQLIPLSGGTEFYNNQFNIPDFNLTGIREGIFFHIKPITPAPRDGYYYTFNKGLYTALVDPFNKHLYLILADGSGFYDVSLEPYVNGPILNYINLNEDSFILGAIDPSKPVWNPLKYFKLDFNLIRFRIKPRVITYEFNKIGLTFIPCHTHCMGKGGIISKV